MLINNTLTRMALAASLLGTAGIVHGATQGTLGATSQGTVQVSYAKSSSVQISALDDLDFGTQAVMTTDGSRTDGFCVFSSSGAYSITASGSNTSAGTNFVMADAGEVNILPYTVQLNGTAVTQNTAIATQPGNRDSLTCNGVNNASVEVFVNAADFNAAAPVTYTDTITLLVEPE